MGRALGIIEAHDQTQAPLFLFLAYESPHSPRQCPQEYVDAYAQSIEDETRRIYAGMVSVMDESVGNITNALASKGYLGTDGNTLIIFLSDNGAPISNAGGYRNGGSNWALRGGKSTTYEGGTRVNCIVYGTENLIAAQNIGTTYEQLMDVADLFPTLLSAANIDYKQYIADADDVPFDGIDHWQGLSEYHPLPRNDAHFAYRQNLYYSTSGLRNSALRSFWMKLFPDGSGGEPDGYCCNQNYHLKKMNDSKIFLNQTNKVKVNAALYNLQIDPNEYVDVALDNEGIVNELLFKTNQIEQTALPAVENDPNCPNSPANPPIDPVLGIPYWEPWC